MKPNRCIVIHLDGPRSLKTVAVSLERCVVMSNYYTPDGLYDSSELLDRPPTPGEAHQALCAAPRSQSFAALSPKDRAGVLGRLAHIAAGLPPPDAPRARRRCGGGGAGS